jgi:hypothetical protein
MNKNKVSADPAEREERGSQGRFAHNQDDKMSHSGKTHEGMSQGGNGLSQKRDRMEEVSRKGGRTQH